LINTFVCYSVSHILVASSIILELYTCNYDNHLVISNHFQDSYSLYSLIKQKKSKWKDVFFLPDPGKKYRGSSLRNRLDRLQAFKNFRIPSILYNTNNLFLFHDEQVLGNWIFYKLKHTNKQLQCILVQDGLGNFLKQRKLSMLQYFKILIKRKLFKMNILNSEYYGDSKSIDEIWFYMKFKEIPLPLRKKAKDISTLFYKSLFKNFKYFQKIFSALNVSLYSSELNYILLDQPLAQDKLMSIKEEDLFWKRIISDIYSVYPKAKLIFKRHSRRREEMFFFTSNNNIVLDKGSYPIELLIPLVINKTNFYPCIITHSSAAAYILNKLGNFPAIFLINLIKKSNKKLQYYDFFKFSKNIFLPNSWSEFYNLLITLRDRKA